MDKRRQIVLMDSARIRRTIKRIVFQIAEKAKGRDVLLIGLNEQGSAIADEIGTLLGNVLDQDTGVVHFQVDSDSQDHSFPNKYNLTGKMIVLVDDVMFSGKTIFTALKAILDNLGCSVYTAVLIDRGHRTLPVHAAFVGMEIPTKPNEHVELILKQDKAETVLLFKTI